MRIISIILYLPFLLGAMAITTAAAGPAQPGQTGLRVSANGRFLVTQDGKPFFWLGDTGWLLLEKLNREDACKYLEARRKQGFTVIQVMLLHGLDEKDIYGDKALVNGDLSRPDTTGHYWDQVDYVVRQAADRGIYIALVPLWGGNVKSGRVNPDNATVYARFLALRYRDMPNVIWMNGGDIKGSDHEQVWNAIGSTLKANDPGNLVTYHPRGRTSSSTWFQDQSWLDFNSVQSGHRRYNQDTSAGDLHYGEDNWRYIRADYARTPVKPVLDAEPSYERIPQGLHDTRQPRWTDKDVRRYGYWSVFAGACGYTYGDNPVMQMHKREEGVGAYGATEFWEDALQDPGARQMVYLKKLLLSRPYLDRIPDQSLISGDQGGEYNYLIATRGKQYAFVYTYNGRTMSIQLGKIAGDRVKASWYSPRDGSWKKIGVFANKGVRTFDPPGQVENGNDWVLVLDGITLDGITAGGSSKSVYMFTSFHEPATDGLRFLYSYDGYHWTDLGDTFLKPTVGGGGQSASGTGAAAAAKPVMRDPSIAQGPDGVFHLVWTSGWEGDKGFGYASSRDLIHWSDEQFIPVMDYEPTTVNVWAPEVFYDREGKQFIIVWASTIPHRFPRGEEPEDNNHRLYYTTTKDFKTFTKTALFFDPGFSSIDAMIVRRAAGQYVLVFKDNTRPQRDIRVAFSDRAAGPYGNVSAPFTEPFTEGPTTTKVGKDWLIYYDMYRKKTFGAVRTEDFKTFTNIDSLISVPAGHKHGTIFMTSRKIVQKLQAYERNKPQKLS